MYYVTKKFRFESAHRLHKYDGECANLHGHSYVVEVTFKGEKLNDIGMLIDFSEVKHIVKNSIIGRCDHAYLNDIFVAEVNPTAEIMARVFFEVMREETKYVDEDIDVHSVKVWETEDNCATYMEG